MLGNIQIFFGRVADVTDPEKSRRLKISINGMTDKLKTEDLPWYIPMTNDYIPEINDVVPVLIFDNVLSSGLYGKKLGKKLSTLSDGDYSNYLEIFKRIVNNKLVNLSYKESTGIEFINDDTGITIEGNKLLLFCASNGIILSEDSIILGKEDLAQYALKGDEVLKLLENMCTILQDLVKLFSPAASPDIMPAFIAGSSTPYTMAYSAPFTALSTKASLILTNIATLSAGITSSLLQSNKVKIE